MKSLRGKTDAQYISFGNRGGRTAKSNHTKNTLASFASGILAALFLFVTIVSAAGAESMTALAADDPQEILNKAASEYGAEGSADGYYKTFEKYSKEKEIDKNSFAYLMDRMLTTGYINDVSKASAEIGKSVPANGQACNPNATGNGTPIYHNCDVPNLMTEFFQDAATMLITSGPQNAETEVATVSNKWFGLPGNIPGNHVPVNPNERLVKYTALELYGYNLKYTQYAGEFDHIKVMTSARALSNFGFMDDLKLSVTTVVNSITSSVNKAASNFTASLSGGSIFSAVGSAFTGLFEGAVSGGIRTVLDTSDLNVINSNAWYRVGYGSTLYNAREASQEELAAAAKAQFLNMLSHYQPDDADVPEELKAIQVLPEDPKDAISKCVYKNSAGVNVEWGDTSRSPGPTESECTEMANDAYAARQAVEEPETLDAPYSSWSEDGTQKLETLAAWKETHKSHFDMADKYMMECDLDTNEANRKNGLANLRACWPGEYDRVEQIALKDVQFEINNEWVQEYVSAKALAKWMSENSDNNFNAPWQRFVCTDANGSDLKDGSDFVMAFNDKGQLNDKCGGIRPPIQNGFFGNGYTGDANPGVDTRNEALDNALLSALFPIDSLLNTAANIGLSTAVITTRISNTVINLTFSPILETLGLDKMVVEGINALRDSLFFPLAMLVIGFAGVTTLIKVGKSRDYGQQAVSILIMVAIFVSGVFLMYRPASVIKAVDEFPAMIEQAIVGTIFSAGNDVEDKLCTATGTVSEAPIDGLDNQPLKYNPRTATRSLMCENWRVFAFTPWVYGQWGTGFENLYSNDTEKPNKFTNTNTDLVGTAKVKMGDGQTIRNWGLYQLDVLSSGTSTDRDLNKKAGFVNRDFYKIIDAQAGPNNGAGVDGSHFESWSGKNGFARVMVGLMSGFVSFIGLITVCAFAIAKIEISFVVTVMLLFMPIMFLMGLHPTAGRMKLKSYAGTILGLMIQRIVLVTLLAVMFRVVLGFSSSGSGYTLIAFATVASCIAFLIYKKQITSWAFNAVGQKFGGTFGGESVSNPRRAIGGLIPGSVKNYTAQGKRAVSSVTSGAVGGYLSGRGAWAGANESVKIQLDQLKNQQRRAGYGVFQSLYVAGKSGSDSARRSNRDGVKQRELAKDVVADTQFGVDATIGQRAFDKLPESEKEGSNGKDENPIDLGLAPLSRPKNVNKLETRETPKTARELAKLARLNEKLAKLEAMQDEVNYHDTTSARRMESDDIESISSNQEELKRKREQSTSADTDVYFDADVYFDDEAPKNKLEKKISKIEEKQGELRGKIIRREDREYMRSKRSRIMVDELTRIFDRHKEVEDELRKNGGK